MHGKKMIAPIIVTIIVLLYFGGIAYLFFVDKMLPLIWKAILVVIPLLFAGVGVYVLYERIQEIRSGEEDDLSKY
ncbi:MAG: hypothetical protein ACI4U3_04520 [Traorella sp.]